MRIFIFTAEKLILAEFSNVSIFKLILEYRDY